MWEKFVTGSQPHQRDLTRSNSCMAQRRCLVSARVGAMFLVVFLLTVLLAGRVLVLNQMTGIRSNISVLNDRKGFLEGEAACLYQKWNRETSAEVICSRAEDDLGLISPDEPELVLVLNPDGSSNDRWSLPGWLENLTAGNSAMAAEPVAIQTTGNMVSLEPRAGKGIATWGGQN